MAKYDANGNGTFSKEEYEGHEAHTVPSLLASRPHPLPSLALLRRVRCIVKDVTNFKGQSKSYRRAFFMQGGITVLRVVNMLVMGSIAVETTKESHVKGGGLMTDTSGDVVKVDTAESSHALFDLPSKSAGRRVIG